MGEDAASSPRSLQAFNPNTKPNHREPRPRALRTRDEVVVVVGGAHGDDAARVRQDDDAPRSQPTTPRRVVTAAARARLLARLLA